MGSVRRILIPGLFLILPLFSMAQEVRFYAETEMSDIPADGYFELNFKIENGSGLELIPPSFAEFNLLGGPSRSSQTSIINGKVSKSSSFTYVLEPKRTGRFQIGPATVMVEGKKYVSKPIFIDVVKEKSSAGFNDQIKNNGEIFVRMEAHPEIAYPGQQVILDYVVYTRIDFNSYTFNSESKYTGIYVKPFKNYNAGTRKKVINGKAYMTRIIRRLALYPQQSGTLTIDPAVITLGIPMESDDPFGSLFSSSKPKQVKTNELNIEVRPLPVPAPEGFVGAVGDFEYAVTSDKDVLTTDDAAMLNIKITGNGDMKKIQTPVLPVDSVIDYYPAEVMEDIEQETAGEWKGTKSYVIDLTPKKEGTYKIELPPFVYFDPKTKEYKTIKPEPLPLTVNKGSDKPKVEEDYAELKTELTYFNKNKTVILTSLGGLVLLGLIFFAVKPKKKAEDAGIVPAKIGDENVKTEVEVNSEIQPEEEISWLEVEHLKDTENFKEFYRVLNGILGKHLSEKLNIPFSRFSIQEVVNKLQQVDVEEVLIQNTVQTMQRLESAVYAQHVDKTIANDMLESVKTLISKLSDIHFI